MIDRLFESLLLLLLGMGGVFCSLLLLAFMIHVLRTVDERLNRRRIDQYARTLETQDPDQINDELAAVIAAAAASTFRRPIAIRRIRLFESRDAGPWEVTGRLNIMASHAIAKRKGSS